MISTNILKDSESFCLQNKENNSVFYAPCEVCIGFPSCRAPSRFCALCTGPSVRVRYTEAHRFLLHQVASQGQARLRKRARSFYCCGSEGPHVLGWVFSNGLKILPLWPVKASGNFPFSPEIRALFGPFWLNSFSQFPVLVNLGLKIGFGME